jgi:exopolysaccharide production protein ExoQ
MTGTTSGVRRWVTAEPVLGRVIPPRIRPESFLDRWWYTIGAILVIVGSDYEYRIRDATGATAGGIDTAIMLELVTYGIGLGLLLSRRQHPPRIVRLPPHVLLCCFWAGLMLLSVVYAIYAQYALVRAGQSAVVVAMVLQAATNGGRAHFHRFAHAYLVLIAVSIGYGVVRPSTPLNRLQEGRFTWLAIHPTLAGVLTGLAAVIALGYVISSDEPRPGPTWPRWLYVALFVLSLGGMFAVHTRGAVLGATVGLVLLLVMYLRRRGRSALALYGLVGVGVAALAATDLVVAYFVRGEDPSKITTLNSRTDIWAVAGAAVEQQPVWGYGIGATKGLFLDELGVGGGHNAVVNVVVELGLVGGVCWLGMLAATLLAAWRLPRTNPGSPRIDRVLVLSILAFLLVDGMFFEGAGAAANVASGWVIACVGWVWALMREPSAAGDGPSRR